MRYYTGTTLENLLSIIKGGYIVTRPPHRVWKEYSQNYIYMIPQKSVDKSVVINGHTINKSIEQAFKMANYTVQELNQTKRVILELDGLNDSLMEIDTDNRDIDAVKYPLDISVDNIKNIYIDTVDCSYLIKSYITLMKLTYSFYDTFDFAGSTSIEDAFAQLIKDLDPQENKDLIQFIKENNLEGKEHMALLTYSLDLLNDNFNFDEYSLEEFTNFFSVVE